MKPPSAMRRPPNPGRGCPHCLAVAAVARSSWWGGATATVRRGPSGSWTRGWKRLARWPLDASTLWTSPHPFHAAWSGSRRNRPCDRMPTPWTMTSPAQSRRQTGQVIRSWPPARPGGERRTRWGVRPRCAPRTCLVRPAPGCGDRGCFATVAVARPTPSTVAAIAAPMCPAARRAATSPAVHPRCPRVAAPAVLARQDSAHPQPNRNAGVVSSVSQRDPLVVPVRRVRAVAHREWCRRDPRAAVSRLIAASRGLPQRCLPTLASLRPSSSCSCAIACRKSAVAPDPMRVEAKLRPTFRRPSRTVFHTVAERLREPNRGFGKNCGVSSSDAAPAGRHSAGEIQRPEERQVVRGRSSGIEQGEVVLSLVPGRCGGSLTG